MFPKCPEHRNAEGTLSEYSRNIACRLGFMPFIQRDFFMKIQKYIFEKYQDYNIAITRQGKGQLAVS